MYVFTRYSVQGATITAVQEPVPLIHTYEGQPESLPTLALFSSQDSFLEAVLIHRRIQLACAVPTGDRVWHLLRLFKSMLTWETQECLFGHGRRMGVRSVSSSNAVKI